MLDLIEAALEARIASIPGEGAIAWWGRVFEPLKGTPYLHAAITAQSRRPMALDAASPLLWEGYLQLTVAHPRAEGPGAARARADAVVAHFPRGLNLPAGTGSIVLMSTSVQPMMEAIDWLNYPVIINWICEEIPT